MIPGVASASKAQASVRGIILCADDFAISAGVTAGIEELAAADHLSATSAIVTLPRWRQDAPRLADLAGRIAIGLHINLTLARPLGPMPKLAPDGHLPRLSQLVRHAMLGRMDRAEIAAEVTRQIESFRRDAGRDPDFIDGHQHAHTLPGVRDGVLDALHQAFPGAKPLVRDPADQRARILARRASTGKALLISLLASGFGARLGKAGFPTNQGFSGVSAFDRAVPFADELGRFMSHPGPRHLVMCHPGRADPELAALDPVTARREEELAAILTYPELPALIWHPRRDPGGKLHWPGEDTP